VPGAASAPVAAAPDTTPKPRRTTLEVASYLSVDRAEIERDRLIAATGLDGWVIAGSDDGTEMYRVLLGIFSNQQRAESAASSVLSQGLVTQARVVPLPPKHLRH
jgi:cell division protein FtsN